MFYGDYAKVAHHLKIPVIQDDEQARLNALKDYQILDSHAEVVFDNLTKLAAELCGTPIAVITLIDSARQWFKSTYGLNIKETCRDISFCGHAILQNNLFEVHNALKDERFKDNPLVIEAPHIRFYAAYPLMTAHGHTLGTLAVIDSVPKTLDEQQRNALARIAKQVLFELEHRKAQLKSADYSQQYANSSVFYDALLNSADESIISTTPDGVITSFNHGAEKMLGYRAEDLVGLHTPALFHDMDEIVHYADILSHEFGITVLPGFEVFVYKAKRGQTDSRKWTYVHQNGSRITVNLSVTALRDDQGELLGYLGVARDITATLAAQHDLASVSAILERTGEMAKIGGWELNLANSQIKWSKEVFRIHELDTDVPPTLTQAISYYSPEARTLLEQAVDNSVKHGTPWDLTLPFTTAKGKPIWVRTQGSAMFEANLAVRLIGTFQDVTASKQSELDLAWLNRALHMLSKANHALTQIHHEKRLMTEICRIAVEVGGYRMAWVGYTEHDAYKTVSPQAYFGDRGEAYIQSINLSWSEELPVGRGPAGRAIRSGQPIIVEDILQDATFPVKTIATQFGYRGIAVLPLKLRQKTIGMLALYSAEARSFSRAEIELLQELVDNLSTGLSNLQSELERQRLSNAMIRVAIGVTSGSSADFFKDLVISMTETLQADAGYIAQLHGTKPLIATMLAVRVDNRFRDNFQFTIPNSVAEAFFDHADLVVVKQQAAQHYAYLSMMKFYPFEAFAGLRLRDSKGQDIGLLFVFFKQALHDQFDDFIQSVLKIFAARTASELERLNDDMIIKEQASLLDKTNDAIVIYDMQQRITFWNKGAEALYGWSAPEALAQPIHQLLKHEQAAFTYALQQVLAHGEWKGEFIEQHKHGGQLVIESRWTLLRDGNGQPKSIFSIKSDVTLRKQAEDEIRHFAFYDVLTKLPNRRLLMDRLEQALSAASRIQQFGAILFIDLDNFKQLNDRLGHDKGDSLLKDVAARLKDCVRDCDTVARLGGDEFVIMLEEFDTDLAQAKQHAQMIADKVIAKLNVPFDFDGYLHISTPSIGIAMFSHATNSVDALLKQADTAMYQSKTAGRNRLTFY